MQAASRPRWYQFRLASLLALMALVAVLARPGWQEWRRWQGRGFDLAFWRVGPQRIDTAERQRVAIERGLEWLRMHAEDADWRPSAASGQTQESDL